MNRRRFLKILPGELTSGLQSFFSSIRASVSAARPKRRIARVDISQCLAWAGSTCQLCYLACPLRDRAIMMNDLKPVILAEACDGCAMCETACRTVNDLPAIRMAAR